jgi:hypothetical protein
MVKWQVCTSLIEQFSAMHKDQNPAAFAASSFSDMAEDPRLAATSR